jgi:hypothetical protein
MKTIILTIIIFFQLNSFLLAETAQSLDYFTPFNQKLLDKHIAIDGLSDKITITRVRLFFFRFYT